ncbi:hypothetical protein LWI28_008069 [Acer negundo]|uniref:DUF4283 domain-containing protein n=1 Tax=Acer negundo TaxID=4023 RepID=A0AAD5IHN9_ACENE|nr:hypothetical protein LWI28_008069 [Acer negundo]
MSKVEERSSRKFKREMEFKKGGNKEPLKAANLRLNSSYADAVRVMSYKENSKESNMSYVKDKERLEVVKWEEDASDSSWLNLCVVGVFRKLSDVAYVNKRVSERNIQSSSYYLGDKNILWSFRTIDDRNTFIRIKELWEGVLSFVGSWSNAITPHCMLSWVEFRGIPINIWCEDFFLKPGWVVGEPLLVEEETSGDGNEFFLHFSSGRSDPGGLGLVFGMLGWESGDSSVALGTRFNAPIMKKGFPRKEKLKYNISKTGNAAGLYNTTVQLPMAKASEFRKVVHFNLGLGFDINKGLAFGTPKLGVFVKDRLVCGPPKYGQQKVKGIISNRDGSNSSIAQHGQPHQMLDKGKGVEKTWSCEYSRESASEGSGDGSWLSHSNFKRKYSKGGVNQSISDNIVIDLNNGGGMGQDLGPSFKEALLKGGQGLLPQHESLIDQISSATSSNDSEIVKKLSAEVSISSSEVSLSHVSET